MVDPVLQQNNQADTELRGVRTEFRGEENMALRGADLALVFHVRGTRAVLQYATQRILFRETPRELSVSRPSTITASVIAGSSSSWLGLSGPPIAAGAGIGGPDNPPIKSGESHDEGVCRPTRLLLGVA
jgi:hypothetical protein